MDLENFLIVDSVGDVNGGDFSFSEENDETPVEKTAEVEKPRIERTENVNVGNEHVKKIEVLYCDLCRYYLPHLEDPEAALQKHCSTRNHLRAYLRYKENQSLKITAELIHRRDHKDKHSKKDCKHTFKSKDTSDVNRLFVRILFQILKKNEYRKKIGKSWETLIDITLYPYIFLRFFLLI